MEQKILFTASTLSHIRNFHLPYLFRFKELGYTVHVAAGEGGALPFADRVFPFALKKSICSPVNLYAAAKLRRLIREEHYTLISTHTSLAAFFTRLAAGGSRGRPLMAVTCHGYLFDDATPFLKRSLLLGAELLTARRTDLLFTMNRTDYNIAIQHNLSWGPIIPIPGMGVDLPRFAPPTTQERKTARAKLGLSEESFVLLYAAEFSLRKNQEFIIRAMARMEEQVYLLLAGDGDLLPHCRVLAEELGVLHRVLFTGYCSDMRHLLYAADAAVSASRYEGLPFNLMEAMSVGLPLIVSNVKGNADLVVEGRNGYLYPYGDESAFIAQVLRLTQNDHHRELGHTGRNMAFAYGLDRVRETIMAQYQQLITPSV